MRSRHQNTCTVFSLFENSNCCSTTSGSDNENTTKESATATTTTHRVKKTSSSPAGMVTGDEKLAGATTSYTVLPLPNQTNVKGCEIHCEPSYPPTIKRERGGKALELAWKISEHRECRGKPTIKPFLCGCRNKCVLM